MAPGPRILKRGVDAVRLKASWTLRTLAAMAAIASEGLGIFRSLLSWMSASVDCRVGEAEDSIDIRREWDLRSRALTTAEALGKEALASHGTSMEDIRREWDLRSRAVSELRRANTTAPLSSFDGWKSVDPDVRREKKRAIPNRVTLVVVGELLSQHGSPCAGAWHGSPCVDAGREGASMHQPFRNFCDHTVTKHER